MLADTLQSLFHYSDWADTQVFSAAEQLSDDRLDQAFEMGPGSVRRTLTHMYRAARAWYACCGGLEADTLAPADELQTLGELQAVCRQLGDRRLHWLADVTDLLAMMPYERDGQTFRHSRADMLLHVCNHSTHHRAQVLNMLKRLGAHCPILDVLYMRIRESEHPPLRVDLNTLRRYFAYTDWATGCLLEISAPLQDDRLDRTCDMGMGTLRKTLLHLVDAENWWYGNWHPRANHVWRDSDPDTPAAQLCSAWEEASRQRNMFVGELQDADLGREVTAHPAPGKTLTFSLGETLWQLCNHGTHHRSQALNMLRHTGAEVVLLDYVQRLRLIGEAR